MRKPFILGDSFVTAWVGLEAQREIERWIRDNAEDLDARLRPFGFSSGDISLHDFDRVVYEDELPTDKHLGGE